MEARRQTASRVRINPKLCHGYDLYLLKVILMGCPKSDSMIEYGETFAGIFKTARRRSAIGASGALRAPAGAGFLERRHQGA